MRKENQLLELFFNEPTKHWHFEQIIKSARISRPQALNWLRKFVKEGLVKKVKPRKKRPFYQGNFERPAYQNRKRIWALSQFYKTGFLNHLQSLPKAKAVIIFGSLARADWCRESDLDLFIYGNPEGLEHGKYRRIFHREIQTFVCRNKKELVKFNPALLRNVVKGYWVKGAWDFVEVKAGV